jgi:hypothetical protein
MNFQAFNLLFLVLNFTSIALMVWLVAFQWAPSFLAKPLWLVRVSYCVLFNYTNLLHGFSQSNSTAFPVRDNSGSSPCISQAGDVIRLRFGNCAFIKITPAIILPMAHPSLFDIMEAENTSPVALLPVFHSE